LRSTLCEQQRWLKALLDARWAAGDWPSNVAEPEGRPLQDRALVLRILPQAVLLLGLDRAGTVVDVDART